MSNLEEQKEILKQNAKTITNVFSTPEGKKALEILKAEFDGAEIMAKGDPYKTHYNLGGRDVIVYIEQLLRLNNREV